MINRHKQSIALELLRASMRLYEEGAFFASLHLAGAAWEILGAIEEYLADSNLDTVKAKNGFALEMRISLKQEGEAVWRGRIQNSDKTDIRRHIVYPKNYVKHYSVRGERRDDFDPREVAREYILMAIENLSIITDEPGSDIDQFEDMLHDEEFAEAMKIVSK